MATEVSTQGNTTPCPFCNALFKRVGNHLPHCIQRDGKGYSQYLVLKTLKKKSHSLKTKCPKCDKFFVRLDTHLRNSASCRSIPSPPSPSIHSATMACTTPSHAYLHLPAGEEAMFSTPQNSNSAASLLAGVNKTTSTPLSNPKVKDHLLLPKTTKVGRKPMTTLKALLIPAVMVAIYLSSGEQNPYFLHLYVALKSSKKCTRRGSDHSTMCH